MKNTIKIQEDLKWDHPSLWKNISVGECKDCNQAHILRNGRCWTCELNEKYIQEIKKEFSV